MMTYRDFVAFSLRCAGFADAGAVDRVLAHFPEIRDTEALRIADEQIAAASSFGKSGATYKLSRSV